MPLFSVIIPTKNRSYLARYAIQSVLNQTCRDLEVVVVDNDDSEATQAVVHQFNDPRLRCVRTGDLSMPDNWDRGFREARGEYITVLTDRMALRPWALDHLRQVTASSEHLIISWLLDHIQDKQPDAVFYMRLRWKQNGTPESVTVHDLITRFLNRPYAESLLKLPTGLHSVCHRSVVERLLQGAAGRVCLPAAPDFTFAFQQLAYYDRVLLLNSYLTLAGMRESTGASTQDKGHVGQEFVRQVGAERSYQHVPIKAFFIQNMLYNDFMRVRETVGGNLSQYTLSPVVYFVNCYLYLQQIHCLRVDMRAELDAWEAALNQQPDDVQAEVRQALPPIRRHWQLIGLRERVLYQWLRRAAVPIKKGRVSPVFPDILAALAWEEQQRKGPVT